MKKLKITIVLILVLFVSIIFSSAIFTPLANESKEQDKNAYVVNHKKDGTTYRVTITSNSDSDYIIQLFDKDLKKLQTINLEQFSGQIEFEDVNLDDYMDMVVNTGGTLNETYVLYTWDASLQIFVKVVYEGFEMLSYFEVHEGFINNWVKETSDSGYVQKLVWKSNVLILDSEEYYDLNSGISIYLNGELLIFETEPIIESNRTLVPFRAIFEALGATVDWNGIDRKVTANLNGIKIDLKIESTTAYVNEKTLILDVPAKIINERTFVPLRFIAKNFGFIVNWDEITKSIYIITVNE